MLKVIDKPKKRIIPMGDMETGDVGIIASHSSHNDYRGEYVTRISNGLVILLRDGDYWTIPSTTGLDVEILPKGTIITMEVI